jgi:superfamily I DNA/RNA helicase/mRNA-degrading endonuclease RelE of RelBE toxin-antitoxin system
MLQVAISSDFLRSFATIPRNKQKAVRRALEKFREDPTQPSLNYEPIRDMRDSKVHTLRAGDDYRIIVVSPPEGNVYLLMWVDHHDEAMSWARNKVFEVNKYTGTFQVWEGTEAKGPGANRPTNDRSPANDVGKKAATRSKRLLSEHSDDALLLLGVPEPLLPAVRGLHTESDLDALARFLPREASDALYCLVSGYTTEQTIDELERRSQAPQQAPEDAIDTSDLGAALARDETKAQFKVLGDDHELTEILNAPLSQGRIFLHPSQARLVALKSSGPVRVLGGAGTGKTVVAMHRARHLARDVFTGSDQRILFTTFTKNLALDIRAQLQELCGPEVERIDVLHLHGWASQFLESRGVKVRLIAADTARRFWDQAFAEAAPEDSFDLDFYQDEWRAVVQAQGLLSEADYLKARRSGRGTRLTRPQRQKVWRVLSNYRSRLDRFGSLEADDLIREARLLLEQNDSVPLYSAVVADEVQDFSEGDLELLRRLAPEAPNDLFLVGDGHQRIYGRVASLSRAGINVRGGRTRRLKLNYRTTQHIKTWAVALLSGMLVDDLDEGEDSLKGYYSLRRGSEPLLRHWKSEREEADFIVQQIRAWLSDSETQPGDGSTSICLVARHKHQLENRYKPLLQQAGIAARIVTKEERSGDGVRLATMHRVKGLEFPRVLIAGVQDGEVPHPRKHFADDTARQQHEDSERRLLFVAATRARDALTVTGFGPECPWLQ